MNKAFMREPEPDGTANCPKCGALGVDVGHATLDHHIRPELRDKFGIDGWFCPFPACEIAYFDLYERIILVSELNQPVYPKEIGAAICPCFGFTVDDLDTAIDARSPESIRQLLVKSKSSAAQCAILAASGRCCMQEVQRLYIRGVAGVTRL